MDGETNGSQEATQGQEAKAQEQQQEGTQGTQEVTDGNGVGNGTDYEKQIAERDEKIASLEAPRENPTASTSGCSSRACAT